MALQIHHTHRKQADALGVLLSVVPGDTPHSEWVRAYNPNRNIECTMPKAKDAIERIKLLMSRQAEKEAMPEVDPADDGPRSDDIDGEVLGAVGIEPYAEALALVNAYNEAVLNGDSEARVDDAGVARSPSGVALLGAIAYAEGTCMGDNPWDSESEEGSDEAARFAQWETDWDEAADAKSEEENDDRGGSVVGEKYRAKYAEAGHPTTCGDWLANTLNDECLNAAGISIERFEEICALNGVDTSKYNRTSRGWQGRLRMTGRNLLARRVYLANGQLVLGGVEPDLVIKTAPAEWMAEQRFKMPKSEQPKD